MDIRLQHNIFNIKHPVASQRTACMPIPIGDKGSIMVNKEHYKHCIWGG
jgi:hypothetical protein